MKCVCVCVCVCVQVKYHVVFFDTPVTRGWVSSFHIEPYSEDQDHTTTTTVSTPALYMYMYMYIVHVQHTMLRKLYNMYIHVAIAS